MIPIVVLALMVPTDQWSDLFDDGDRWSSCTITISSSVDVGKPLTRALKDIRKASGINLVKVPSNGQVQITYGSEPYLPSYAAAAALAVPRGRYESGAVLLSEWFLTYPKKFQRHIWQHELGHILGLGHTPKKTDVMYMYSYDSLSTPQWKRKLQKLYPECR